MQIDDKIWGQEINEDLLHRAVVTSLANKRAGTASTKTRKYVSGGGRKPWRQKGTGRARAGSIRSPLWRGGGVVFGPHPRDFACALPKKMRRKALINSLVLKLNENKLTVIDDIKIEKPKTKEMI
ncbi:MAG: 50S ribosomal protein L4, partial [Candidatus Omnitrophica bacterium]|nr:50S ribosomal protein L4 [Candidatus Omnitrophota bacterium]